MKNIELNGQLLVSGHPIKIGDELFAKIMAPVMKQVQEELGQENMKLAYLGFINSAAFHLADLCCSGCARNALAEVDEAIQNRDMSRGIEGLARSIFGDGDTPIH